MAVNAYEETLSKIYKLVQPKLDTNQGIVVGNPLELEYLTAWLLNKDAVYYVDNKVNDKNRPVALYRADGIYTFYWHRDGQWYQLGDTKERTPLGTKLRHITMDSFRAHEPYSAL